jgi:hypothetical protein
LECFVLFWFGFFSVLLGLCCLCCDFFIFVDCGFFVLIDESFRALFLGLLLSALFRLQITPFQSFLHVQTFSWTHPQSDSIQVLNTVRSALIATKCLPWKQTRKLGINSNDNCDQKTHEWLNSMSQLKSWKMRRTEQKTFVNRGFRRETSIWPTGRDIEHLNTGKTDQPFRFPLDFDHQE